MKKPRIYYPHNGNQSLHSARKEGYFMLAEKGKITSLYDMLRFKAEDFYALSRNFEQVQTTTSKLPESVNAIADKTLEHPTFTNALVERLDGISVSLATFGLTLSSQKAKEMSIKVGKHDLTMQKLAQLHSELDWLIEKELKSQVFYYISSGGQKYIQEWETEWRLVIAGFQDVAAEAEAAATAIAIEDFTGAVFHLMQIMEVAFDAIGKHLTGIALPSKREWGLLLGAFEQYFQSRHGGKVDEWSKKEPEWTGILADLRSVKNAWRNPFSHKDEMAVDKFYEPKTAKKIYAAVLAFMEHLTRYLAPSTP